jgi:hypothetical protein
MKARSKLSRSQSLTVLLDPSVIRIKAVPFATTLQHLHIHVSKFKVKKKLHLLSNKLNLHAQINKKLKELVVSTSI